VSSSWIEMCVIWAVLSVDLPASVDSDWWWRWNVIVRIFCVRRIKSTQYHRYFAIPFFANITVKAVQMQSRESWAKWMVSVRLILYTPTKIVWRFFVSFSMFTKPTLLLFIISICRSQRYSNKRRGQISCSYAWWLCIQRRLTGQATEMVSGKW